VDPTLAETVPAGTVVSRGFDGGARRLAHRLRSIRSKGGSDRGGQDDRRQPWKEWVLGGQNINFLTPFDRYIGDVPAAVREGLRLIERYDLRGVHVSADPWSGLIAGWALSRISGRPLISDLRDPWSLHPGKMEMRPPVTRRAVRAIEKAVFFQSSKIVLNTENARDAYVRAYRGVIPERRFAAVRNAFDPALFHYAEFENPDRFTVLYFGRFRLFFEPDQLLAGFKRFVEKRGLDESDARFAFVGRLRDSDLERIDRLGLRPFVERRGQVPFRDCLRELRKSHVLLLVVEPACRLQNPAKLYDYLAAGRPVLAVSANDEVSRILWSTQAGSSVPYGDIEAMASRLSELYDEHEAGEELRVDPRAVEPFTAAEQANKMAAVLEEATGGEER
jgi:glycosyltransferase involved in cell wall biosynthesis